LSAARLNDPRDPKLRIECSSPIGELILRSPG